MAFTVYRSSAGSGKTYTLVREYLSLVLSSPGQFRRILAITFTNKAANEMKDRIVQVLRKISLYSKEKPDPVVENLLDEISKKTGRNLDTLVQNAGIVLSEILHNYSEFAVRTIDSFVHRILRNFAFDLNIPQNFEVEIDTDNIYRQVIDLLISKAGTDESLTRFLVEFVKTRAEEEKNWQIEAELLRIAHWLGMEGSSEMLEKNTHLDLSDYIRIDRTLISSMRTFENAIRTWAVEATDIIDSVGIPYSAFAYGKRGLPGYFNAIAGEQYHKVVPSATMNRIMEDQKWYASGVSREDQDAIDSVRDELQERWDQIQRQRKEKYEQYLLYGEIRKNLFPLAILDKINQVLEEFKRENNILLISEFNQRIGEIVLEEPVPFIYERAGEKYTHFLIDEFQDTSVLQWQNLLPLIENGLASGFDTLLVGDAKQAIYRWRNSEVEQFVKLPEIFGRREGPVHILREKVLKDHYSPRILESNYRSCPEIVHFNNDFFTYVKGFLPEQDRVIYDDVSQKAATPQTGGYVTVTFHTGEAELDFDEFNMNTVQRILREAQARGFQLRDIALLCRSNKEGSKLAGSLVENNIPVVSSESIRLVASPKVRLLTAFLRLFIDQGDLLARTETIHLLYQLDLLHGDLHSFLQNVKTAQTKKGKNPESFFNLIQNLGIDLNPGKLQTLPLYDLCEELIRILQFDSKSDPFILFFSDLVLEQAKRNGSSVLQFLEYWDLKKSGLSIVVPEDLNAVRIMTIHKAKGLEFPVVIYPYVNELLQKTHKKMWIELDETIPPELNAALVNTNKNLEDTSFGNRVVREQEKSLLDMVNLLYVVLTRPTDELYILCDEPKSSHHPPNSIPSLFVGYLKETGNWQDGQLEYSFGSPSAIPAQHSREEPVSSSIPFVSKSWRDRVLVSYQAPVNWDVDDPERKQEWGNLIHRILSRIIKPQDLEPVLKEFLGQGILVEKEYNTLYGLIREFLDRPDVSCYFGKGLNVLTESEIITQKGKVLRPDRIVLKENETLIIDFKTGNPSEQHKTQMKTYMDVVRNMLYPGVQGVILYLNPIAPVKLV